MQINFGWCKGDDNFGGRQRKELDDFTKSLGKQMTLVMYRMQDTENVRMRLREEGRRRVREKFEKEEAEEKAKVRDFSKIFRLQLECKKSMSGREAGEEQEVEAEKGGWGES